VPTDPPDRVEKEPVTAQDSITDGQMITGAPTGDVAPEYITRGIHLGVGGDLHVMLRSGAEITIKGMLQGWQPLRIKKLFQVGTTAQDIFLGW
jgi:hypothetical protein